MLSRAMITGLLGLVMVVPPALADGLEFEAVLSGAEEVPPVQTNTTGKATFEVNADRTEIRFELEIENGVGIFGGPGGHIHCAPFGQNGPIVAFLAAGLTVGLNGEVGVSGTLTDANMIDVGCGATVDEVVDAFRAGLAYVNIHTNRVSSGEVRGQIVAEDDDDDDSDTDSDSDSD